MSASHLKPHRSSLLFLGGLGVACGLVLTLSYGFGSPGLPRFEVEITGDTGDIPLRSPAPLTAQELGHARTAWAYIAAQTNPETGLVNSVAGFPSTTLWDQGSYVAALIAARRLGLLPEAEFLRRAEALLTTFGALPLVEGRLPNKAYNTETLEMVDYENAPTPEGIGWSALDIARMLGMLAILADHAPELAIAVQGATETWKTEDLIANGYLTGAEQRGTLTRLQEGRMGYEQYGARALAHWGQVSEHALSPDRHLIWHQVGGVSVPDDTRDHTDFEAITPIVSEPYVLLGLEFGLTGPMRKQAIQVFRAQEARFNETGMLTALSEDHLDRAPHFAYASITGDNIDWPVLDESGGNHPTLRSLSTKAAFAWHALLNTEYTTMLMAKISPIAVSELGWPAGIYENDGELNSVQSLNTNAIVLEALHFQTFGPLKQK